MGNSKPSAAKMKMLKDLNFRSVPELEMDFVFFTELNEAAVEVVAVSGTAMLLARPVSFFFRTGFYDETATSWLR